MSTIDQIKSEPRPLSAISEYAVYSRGVIQRYFDAKENRERTILNKIDLQIRPGELCALVGPSGCGKSTYMRLILGTEQEKEGEMLLYGKRPGPPDRHRGIVYQKYTLFPYLTVLNNITFGLEVDQLNTFNFYWHGKKHKAFKKQAADYLERIGLSEHAHKYPYQLSGGQQQRVAIAQTLITNPQIILMDEPFGALDPGTRERLQLWLLDLQKREKCTIIFVTHDLEEAVFISTRLIVLSPFYACGGVREEGSKVVVDIDTRGQKKDEYMQEVIELVRDIGFDPKKCQEPSEFVLTHPDAIRPGS